MLCIPLIFCAFLLVCVLHSFISQMMMSANANFQESKSFMRREDWLVLLTGGLVSSSAIGWLVYRDFKAQSLSCKAIMTIAASFAGGMGVYLTGSALICMFRKSDDKRVNSVTSKKEASGFTDRKCASLCEKFDNVMTELEKKIEALKAKKSESLNKRTSMNKIQEWTEVPCKNEDMTKRLNNSNQKGPRNAQMSSNLKENCSDEGIGNRKIKFREEIFSCISELNGYVQGTIDPLPSARNIHFKCAEMSDEMRRQVVMTVKEYANSMLPKLDQVIDEFVDSVCKAVEVLEYDKVHKVKKALKTLGVSENDSTSELKIEMNQYCNALKNVTKSKSRVPSGKKDQPYENVFGANMQSPESISRPSLLDKDIWTNISKRLQQELSKLHIPTSSSIPLIPEEAHKPGLFEVEKIKNTQTDPPAKFTLSQEQMNYLNILKSEL